MGIIRKALCFIGFHDDMTILRKVYWGNCIHAELLCHCGRRFEAFVAGPVRFIREEKYPTDFWVAHDAGLLPKELYDRP